MFQCPLKRKEVVEKPFPLELKKACNTAVVCFFESNVISIDKSVSFELEIRRSFPLSRKMYFHCLYELFSAKLISVIYRKITES